MNERTNERLHCQPLRGCFWFLPWRLPPSWPGCHQEQGCTFSHIPHYTTKHGPVVGEGTGMTHSGSVLPPLTLLEVKATTVHSCCQQPWEQGWWTKFNSYFRETQRGWAVHMEGSMFSWNLQTLKSDLPPSAGNTLSFWASVSPSVA